MLCCTRVVSCCLVLCLCCLVLCRVVLVLSCVVSCCLVLCRVVTRVVFQTRSQKASKYLTFSLNTLRYHIFLFNLIFHLFTCTIRAFPNPIVLLVISFLGFISRYCTNIANTVSTQNTTILCAQSQEITQSGNKTPISFNLRKYVEKYCNGPQ